MEECYFSNKSNNPPWVFFAFFKLYKWYQIAQNIMQIFFQISRIRKKLYSEQITLKMKFYQLYHKQIYYRKSNYRGSRMDARTL